VSDADVLTMLREQQVLPVLRLADAAAAIAAAESALEAGLSLLELTATTPQWDTALARVVAEHDDAVVGLGTVVSADIARRALDGGARFLVSPWPVPEVRAVADRAGVPFLEGAFSPGEVADVASRGPVKLFPAHVGGPQLVRSLKALLPAAVIVPTGGIALDDVPRWLDAGSYAVGVGGDLLAPGGFDRLATLLAKRTAVQP
jgi:2-dehydro-3-deoxyphosphogluconate aldolase / (4S)-4-hydroxy-2-oxoglutarate aldolase